MEMKVRAGPLRGESRGVWVLDIRVNYPYGVSRQKQRCEKVLLGSQNIRAPVRVTILGEIGYSPARISCHRVEQ